MKSNKQNVDIGGRCGLVVAQNIGRRARKAALILTLMVASLNAQAAVRMAALFSNGCVLQRDMVLPVWGWGDPGEHIKVELGTARREATAGATGKWKVEFDPMPAGGPFTLKATGSGVAEAKDVLIGEVWIGVGQSNMMMGVGKSEGGAEALAALGNYPQLRMCHYLGGNVSKEPLTDLKKPAPWGIANPSSSATSFYFALKLYDHFKGKVPVGILNFTEICPVETWTDIKVLDADPIGKLSKRADRGALYQSVVEPVAPFAIRGVLYYQGEMNSGSWKRFHTHMTLLIQSWRKAWNNPKLPFLFVQLPGFEDHRAGTDKKMDMDSATLASLNKGSQHGFVGIREAQMKTFQNVPNTGMAVSIDVGLPWDIHPPFKRQVGERLFLQARHVAYGENDFVYNGPIMKGVEFRDKEVRVKFDLCGSQLVFKNNKCTGFMMAGSDGSFAPAEGHIDGDSVILETPAGIQPLVVRYAWAGYIEASLFNIEGLPAAPFSWTDYTRISAASKIQYKWINSDFGSNEGKEFKNGAEGAKQPDGTSVAQLPLKGEVQFPVKPFGSISYNCDPLFEQYFVRPGSLIGYSLEMALPENEDGLATGYFRLAGSGNYFDNTRVQTGSKQYVLRHLGINIPIKSKKGNLEYLSFSNIGKESQPEAKSFRVRNLSPLTILRPEVSWAGPRTIQLGEVKIKAVIDSQSMTLSNGQKETISLQLKDKAEETKQVTTTLYGLADVLQTDAKDQQQVDLAGNLGMVLTGTHANLFNLVGDHATSDGTGILLMGTDGKLGLEGGPAPEKENVVIRFKGSDKPGEYHAVLRIVTQAANTGTLSRACEGEPPVNLFYLDIPISVKVR